MCTQGLRKRRKTRNVPPLGGLISNFCGEGGVAPARKAGPGSDLRLRLPPDMSYSTRAIPYRKATARRAFSFSPVGTSPTPRLCGYPGNGVLGVLLSIPSRIFLIVTTPFGRAIIQPLCLDLQICWLSILDSYRTFLARAAWPIALYREQVPEISRSALYHPRR